MHCNVNVLPRKPIVLQDVEREFIEAVASEVCAGVRLAVDAWLEKVEAILQSQESDQQKIARISLLTSRKRACRKSQPAPRP
jgi:hypothetical protein